MDRKVGLASKDKQLSHLRGLVREADRTTRMADAAFSFRQMDRFMGHMFAAASFVTENYSSRQTPEVRGATRFLETAGESIGRLDERAGGAVTRLGNALLSEVSPEVLEEEHGGFEVSEADVRFYARLSAEPTESISDRDRWRLLFTRPRMFNDEMNAPIPLEGTVYGTLILADPDELDDRSRLALMIRDECIGLETSFEGLSSKVVDSDEAGNILGSIDRMVALGVTPIVRAERRERARDHDETPNQPDPLEVAQRIAGMWLGEFLEGAEAESGGAIQLFPEAAPPSDFVSEHYSYADRWPQIGGLMIHTNKFLETGLDR